MPDNHMFASTNVGLHLKQIFYSIHGKINLSWKKNMHSVNHFVAPWLNVQVDWAVRFVCRKTLYHEVASVYHSDKQWYVFIITVANNLLASSEVRLELKEFFKEIIRISWGPKRMWGFLYPMFNYSFKLLSFGNTWYVLLYPCCSNITFKTASVLIHSQNPVVHQSPRFQATQPQWSSLLQFVFHSPQQAKTSDKKGAGNPDVILCNSVQMVREKLVIDDKSPETDYVYDLYYIEEGPVDLNAATIGMHNGPDQELIYEHFVEQEQYETYEDDSDSNDEGNWRNDYPEDEPDKRHPDLFDELIDDYCYGDQSSDDDFGEYSEFKKRPGRNMLDYNDDDLDCYSWDGAPVITETYCKCHTVLTGVGNLQH